MKIKKTKIKESKYSKLVGSFDDLERIEEKIDIEKSSFEDVTN